MARYHFDKAVLCQHIISCSHLKSMDLIIKSGLKQILGHFKIITGRDKPRSGGAGFVGDPVYDVVGRFM